MARGETNASWLSRMIQRIRPVTTIIRLEHIKPETSTLVEMWPVPTKNIPEGFAAGVAEEASDIAMDRCDMLAGFQNFAIVCHDKNAVDIGSRSWRIKGALEEDEGAVQPATEKGLAAQLMMQNRFLFDYSLKMVQMWGAGMSEENSRLRLVEQEYHNRRLAMWEGQEELLDGKHARDLEYEALKSRYAKQDRLFGLLEKTFGSKIREYVVNQTKEGGATPPKSNGEASNGESPAEEVTGEVVSPMDDFLSSLTPEQQVKIVDMLTPEQQEKLSKL